MTRIKFCGITSREDAEGAVNAGADALGFNFYPRSPRFLAADLAAGIASSLPARIWRVGVFVNSSPADVLDAASRVGLDTLQFHGDESLEYCKGFSGFRIIRAVRFSEELSVTELVKTLEVVEYLLFDRLLQGSYGGTGEEIAQADLDILQRSSLMDKAFLAGGLRPETVEEKVRLLRPFGVDAASGVEMSPGRKDPDLMRAFVAAVRRAV